MADNPNDPTAAAPDSRNVQTPLPGIEEDMTGTEKYLLLKVPNFAVDPVEKEKQRLMTSYLRIGAADPEWLTQAGADLELLVHAAGTPGGRVEQNGVKVTPPQPGDEDHRLVLGYRTATGEIRRGAAPEGSTAIWVVYEDGAYREVDEDDLASFPAFVDDQRVRDIAGNATKPRADGHTLSVDERKEHSKKLHTRGGWRDHSDGNRITTTYGDKIEVIRGNYKMIVLGRQDDPAVAAGWDASGNHIQDFGATMPGASVRVEWVKDHELEAWHLFNTTEGVIQTSTKGGNFYDFTWGEHVESTTGTESPFTPEKAAEVAELVKNHVDNEVKKGKSVEAARTEIAEKLRKDGWDLTYALEMKRNPNIVEKKWAASIESHLGSSRQWIPSVTEDSYVTNKTSASNIESETVTNTITTSDVTSHVTTSTETNHVDTSTVTNHIGTEVATTYAKALVDTTIVGAQSSTTIAGATSEIAISGAASEIAISGGKMAIDIAHSVLELVIAGKLGINIGVTQDIKIGAFDEISIPDAKKVALTKLNTVLTETTTVLSTSTTSLSDSNTSLEKTIRALQTYLGT